MKSLLNILLVATLVIVTAPKLMSQTNTVKETPYIEVTGTAEKYVVPDEIYISIALKERQEGRENKSIEQQEAQLKQGLSEIGIDLKDLSLSDATSDYVRVKVAKKDVISKSDYLLKVTSASMVGKVFEKLDELKIEEAQIARVSHSEIERFRKEVKIQAIKAAKEKADYLLEAIGEKAGEPLIIQENQYGIAPLANSQFIEEQQSLGLYSTQGYYAKSEPVLQFQKIKVVSSFYIKFAIQP
ncbi:MAG: SIMPL domain-containing protein [Bacteroidales bacterium]|nr:SIMPL domain-containing protein [Bacteroidales bacterium]